jgi:hypothetical protein
MKNIVYVVVGIFALQLAAMPCGAAVTAFVMKQRNDQSAWNTLTSGACSTIGTPCAVAAIALASQQCSADAKFFQRQKVGYSRFSLFLILLSAGFTGVGASSTIANAKIFSTLGGTTGIGAATTAVNSDATADQTSLSAITTAIGKLEALGSSYDGSNAAAAKILLQAPAIVSECDTAAGTSPNAAKPAP